MLLLFWNGSSGTPEATGSVRILPMFGVLRLSIGAVCIVPIEGMVRL